MVWNAQSDINYYENLLQGSNKDEIRLKIEPSDIPRLCRTCLRSATDGCELTKNFEIGAFPVSVGGRNVRVVDMLEELTSLKVDPGGYLPRIVCSNCIQNISGAYFFKLQCFKAERTLIKLLEEVSPSGEKTDVDDSSSGFAEVDHNEKESENLQTEDKKSDSEQTLQEDAQEDEIIEQIFADNIETHDYNEDVKVEEDETEIVEGDPCEGMSVEGGCVSSLNCKECDRTFNTKRELKSHMRETHPPQRVFECEVCQARCCNNQTLKRHMKIHQADQKNKMCTFCDKSFIRADDLKRHIRTHTGERPYACKLCPKRYKQSSELKEHMTTHSRERLYVCTVCGKCLLTRNGHYIHMKAHLGLKNHVCKICDNRYVTSGELSSHMKHIHDKRRPYSCEIGNCERKFPTKLSLNIHVRSHTGERPFVCPTCGKGLATASSLSDHVLTHSGEKKKICNLCEKAFCTSQSLRKHLRLQHGLEKKSSNEGTNDPPANDTQSHHDVGSQDSIENGQQLTEDSYDIVFMDETNEVIIEESAEEYHNLSQEEHVAIAYFEE